MSAAPQSANCHLDMRISSLIDHRRPSVHARHHASVNWLERKLRFLTAFCPCYRLAPAHREKPAMRCISYRSWGQALGRNLMGAAAATAGEHYAIPSEQCMAEGVGTG